MTLPDNLVAMDVQCNDCNCSVSNAALAWKLKQARSKYSNLDDDHQVTVTLPKSHLDFLNMVFPPSPPSSNDTDDTGADEILIATPLDQTVQAVSSTKTQSDNAIVDCSTYQASTITDKLTSILASVSPPASVNGRCGEDKTISEHLSKMTATEENHYRGTASGSSMTNLETCVIKSHEFIPLKNDDVSKLPYFETTVKESPQSLSSKHDADTGVYSKPGRPAVKRKRLTKPLTFPPCNVCGGKASGLHYGANSCEACKGFFRRYLLKKIEYKCCKDSKCEITNRSRGNCSGCRLKKCLSLGMAKEKVQMGRYNLAKRTEAIINMNKIRTENDEVALKNIESDSESSHTEECAEIIGKQCCMTSNLNQSETFSVALIEELTQAMIDMQPFGPDIITEEQINMKLAEHSEYYKNLVSLYGEMKPVPKEEYYKLYNDYAIDVDGRMEEFKESVEHIDHIVALYCNFAKHIPGFYKLPNKDQSNLLKSARIDVFALLMHKGYSDDLQVFLNTNGKAYHINQCADKFMTRDTCVSIGQIHVRWQNLTLTKEETALLMAIVLMFPDRCKILKRPLIESIQQSLIDLLFDLLKRTHGSEAHLRFARMIDVVIFSRQGTDICHQEYNELCKDQVLLREFPVLKEFKFEEKYKDQ